MRFVKFVLRQIVTLGALTALGCSGGGGGGGGATSMKEVVPPANAGQVDGFVYSSQQTVVVDIALPSSMGQTLVSLYSKNPTPASPYDQAGNPVPAPEPDLLAQGQADNSRHYRETVTVPAGAATLYVGPIIGLEPKGVDVPIVNGTATYNSFTVTPGGM